MKLNRRWHQVQQSDSFPDQRKVSKQRIFLSQIYFLSARKFFSFLCDSLRKLMLIKFNCFQELPICVFEDNWGWYFDCIAIIGKLCCQYKVKWSQWGEPFFSCTQHDAHSHRKSENLSVLTIILKFHCYCYCYENDIFSISLTLALKLTEGKKINILPKI